MEGLVCEVNGDLLISLQFVYGVYVILEKET